MLNEEKIRDNIRCKWVGINEAMQQLWIEAGANGGTLTQKEIEKIWSVEQQNQEQQEKIWAKYN